MNEGAKMTDVRPLLTAMLNLTASHREHEKFYAVSPREQAVTLQRHSRTLHALADRWTTAEPTTGSGAFSPYEGAADLARAQVVASGWPRRQVAGPAAPADPR